MVYLCTCTHTEAHAFSDGYVPGTFGVAYMISSSGYINICHQTDNSDTGLSLPDRTKSFFVKLKKYTTTHTHTPPHTDMEEHPFGDGYVPETFGV